MAESSLNRHLQCSICFIFGWFAVTLTPRLPDSSWWSSFIFTVRWTFQRNRWKISSPRVTRGGGEGCLGYPRPYKRGLTTSVYGCLCISSIKFLSYFGLRIYKEGWGWMDFLQISQEDFLFIISTCRFHSSSRLVKSGCYGWEMWRHMNNDVKPCSKGTRVFRLFSVKKNYKMPTKKKKQENV